MLNKDIIAAGGAEIYFVHVTTRNISYSQRKVVCESEAGKPLFL